MSSIEYLRAKKCPQDVCLKVSVGGNAAFTQHHSLALQIC